MGKNISRTKIFSRFCFFYSLFLVIILLLLFYFHRYADQRAAREFWTQNQTSLEGAVSLLDNDLMFIDFFCRQMGQNSTLYLLAGEEYSPSDINFFLKGYSLKNQMPAYLLTYPEMPVSNYFMYFRNSDYVASVNKFQTDRLHYQRAYPTDSPDFNTWKSYISAENGGGTMYFTPRNILSGAADAYLYLMDMDSLSYRSLPVTAGFEFDYLKLKDIFSSVSLAENGCLLVLDEEGSPIFWFTEDNTDRQPLTDTEYAQLPALLPGLSYQGGFSELNYLGRKMHVIQETSQINNWTYYLVQPQSLFVPSYRTLYALIAMLTGVLGAVVVALLVQNSMRPIIALDSELQETITDRDQLQETIDLQKPILVNSYVRQLMLGDVSTEPEGDYIREFLEFPETGLCYNVLYLVAYNNENLEDSGQTLPLNDEKTFTLVLEVLKAEMGGIPMLPYRIAERTGALLLSCDASEADSFIMKIQAVIIRLHERLLDQHAIWLFAGIGCSTDSLMNVWESFQQAQEAVNYATRKYIFLPYEIITKNSNAFYYPPELSTKMINFITSGNLPQVLELFNLLHRENIDARSLPVDLLKYLMSDIRNTLLKARFALSSSTDQTVLEALDARFREHLSFKLCEDIAIDLTNLFQVAEKDTSLASAIEKYITENYSDPSLCLNKISDEFHISETYFSHMFKEKTGTNFSTYLENVRMQEAMRLLRNSDKNLSELYLMVGYNNATTFRRAFKKTFGITPSSVREGQ